jgi:hypothetical protein
MHTTTSTERARALVAALAHALARLAHRARVAASRSRLACQAGQGTVEYVALILLVAGLMAIVVTSGKTSGTTIAKKVTDKIEESIEGVGKAPTAK